MNYRILIVDDEADILEFIRYNLKKEGYDVYTASDGEEALRTAAEVSPHLVLLDVMMPRMDGMEACRRLRKMPQTEDAVIAFLTARAEDYSQVAGFDAGADDYIAKPVRPNVLVSRIRALLKRVDSGAGSAESQEAEPDRRSLIIDRERYVVLKNGEEIVLPRKMFELLALLYSKPQKVFLRDEIFAAVWGDDVVVGERTIDVHIRKLREKIGADYIVTVKGVGYKYQDIHEA
ncbi:response regulator transcription factor [Rikenella microfusus]|uniref:Alkaline phosphatase synthesis transcriptional regulatory protein phoP n=2 Tax=Rikenella microfusus TaxID=28139 RepID=A0A379MSH2_9BACT|nr:response regulator transcription factor [Rikenella microfusus]SUE34376.1 Alkaline phosphatase synthesis transcriptional regulatory protein phoP [Rikenella microfusus]HJE89203.1 response regulator transcription factor [Rikenella microfusus]